MGNSCKSVAETQLVWLFQVVDLDNENFFSLMDDTGDTRDDLKLTDLCSISSYDEVMKMKKKAEAENNVLIVSIPKFTAVCIFHWESPFQWPMANRCQVLYCSLLI